MQRYVLVIGSEVILKDKDSSMFLREEFTRSLEEGYEGYKDFLVQNHIPDNEFNPDLRAFLEKKLFRVIITTTTDDLLERILTKIWGKDLVIKNFYGESPDIDLMSRSEFNDVAPILYYAFGKAEPGKHFVVTEDDKLRAVADWLGKKDRYPTNFYQYVMTKKLLALGCKQDDWLFRFFWYSLRKDVRVITSGKENQGTEVTVGEESIKGKVAIELKEEDDSLKRYLKNKGLLYENDARAFLYDFNSYTNISKGSSTLQELMEMNVNRIEGGIFISYASEDFKLAMNLYLRLKEKNNTVWIDHEKLYPGDDYDDRIKNAINECRFFIPILSRTISDDYNKGEFEQADPKKRRYYLKEWDLATERLKNGDKMKLIPMVIDGFDVKSEVYNSTPWKKSEIDKTVCKEINSLLIALKKE